MPAAIAPLPEGLVRTLAERLRAGEAPDDVATGIVETVPDEAHAALLDALVPVVDEERFVALLAALLDHPLEIGVEEHIVGLLAQAQAPVALELLVALGEQAGAKAVRRAAKQALFRLRGAGVAVPEPERAPAAPQHNVASWPVAQAWATRIDGIGSQAVILARERPGGTGSLAYISMVISDDRGLVDGMGQLGVSANHVRQRAERVALPPGASPYAVSPEYVCWRIRQGEETNRRAGQRVAPEYLTWRHLLAGIDAGWQPDLEVLCREWARPDQLDRTSVLMYALELSDWWPDPAGSEGRAVNRFIADVTAALDALPNAGRVADPDPLTLEPPPYLEMLTETHYLAQLWPFDAAGSRAIEAAIDTHLDAIVPAGRRRRYRNALLQTGYLNGLNARPMLSSLLMTAAWALDPATGIPPQRHPFLRQMLRKAVEVLVFG